VILSLNANDGFSVIKTRCMEVLRDISVSEVSKIFESLKISVGKESVSDIFKKKKKRSDNKIKKKLKEVMVKGKQLDL
jgi:hypothetical protein